MNTQGVEVNTKTFQSWYHRRCYPPLVMTPGEKIREARERLGLSQAQLGKQAGGCSQATIDKIESGETTRSKFLPLIAKRLGIALDELDQAYAAMSQHKAPVVEMAHIVSGERNFPVYASAEGGPGEVIRSSDPVDFLPRPAPVGHVRTAYGMIISGESMMPEYRPGDTAIVNPLLPVIGGEVYVFYREKDGEARATIKQLRRASADTWHVHQHNPPDGQKHDFTLSRKEWTICHRVIGKFSRL